MQSFGLLLIGLETPATRSAQALFHLRTREELQTVMFLQLVAGGHLLLYITRTAKGWFFLRPWPALLLIGALLATQALAVLMSGFGWLVPAIPWTTIAWVWAYNLVWLFVLGGVRMRPTHARRLPPAAGAALAIVGARCQSAVEPSG